VLDHLREAGFDLELAGIVASMDDNAANELKKMNIPPVPRMAWVLIGFRVIFGQRFGKPVVRQHGGIFRFRRGAKRLPG